MQLSILAALGFLYQPRSGQIWDPSCFAAANGTYFCVFMYSASDGVHWNGSYESGWLARSDDGARWYDVGPIAPSRPSTQWWKGFVLQLSDDPPLFVMNHGVYEHGNNDALRVLTSSDLVNWTVASTSTPDARWYHPQGRWDHMYMSRRDEGGYVGFAVSSPLNDTRYAHTWPGIQRSADGTSWTAYAPLNVSWHGVTPQGIEEGGFEQIELPGGSRRYFLLGGGGAAHASMSYSMWVFRSENMEGPYEPVTDAFRLSGGGSPRASFEFGALAAWCRGRDGERLISQYMTAKGRGRQDVWMLPLRRPVATASGTLRLEYWPGNDPLTQGPVLHEAPRSRVSCGGGDDALSVSWLASLAAAQHDAGAVLTARIVGASGAGAVGLALEDVSATTAPRNLTAALVSLGTDGDPATAAYVLRSGGGTPSVLDRSGAFSCGDGRQCGVATLTAIEPNATDGSLLLFFRKGMTELYVNRRLAQTFVYGEASPLPATGAGRVGLACSGAAALEVENVTIRTLNLDVGS